MCNERRRKEDGVYVLRDLQRGGNVVMFFSDRLKGFCEKEGN